ncbi:P-loop containing nucleoside triphosphate hydrolase [Glarea lozoyensis ATCC 20868]|uniref:p-loop containing nucleoside triphosphate hydrolase n=1 Tax=Glarea lozoyensis (strain ATCC 20868 / MF5171) TaxID=1116229 RepID=S3E6P0_GLAL2|nr:P-loop containing nucleoside triphosphate hydrolase [Glarea lozoyensis ATCC 20868]EPE34048.1 P-loop containing nucleoside triphosphate hydrolase [Glarea lozoyensis ATCC 20868]
MASDESLPTLKILMIGPSGSGKSALLIRYCDNQFDNESSTATIGVDFKLKRLSVHGQPYRLNLLDTAGQERFRTLSTSYYRGAAGIILVYDISSRESFNSMERWFEECESNMMEGAKMYLVGGKLDKVQGAGGEAKRKVSEEEGRRLAERWGTVGFMECSAKTGEGVKAAFAECVEGIVKDGGLVAAGGRGRGTVSVAGAEEVDSGCAC